MCFHLSWILASTASHVQSSHNQFVKPGKHQLDKCMAMIHLGPLLLAAKFSSVGDVLNLSAFSVISWLAARVALASLYCWISRRSGKLGAHWWLKSNGLAGQM